MGERLEEKLNRICQEIWSFTQSQLHLEMRQFDRAIYAFYLMKNETTAFWGTDGTSIYYNEKYVIESYEKGQIYLNRGYVHMMLHCLFGHLFHRNGRLIDYWNLACDIVVESIIDDWKKKAIHRPVTSQRTKIYQAMRQQVKVLTAESVYEVLLNTRMTEQEFTQLLAEFEVDDHSFWDEENKQPNQPPMQQRQKKWDDISQKILMELEQFSDEAGEEGELTKKTLKMENRQRYHYRDFLKKFSVIREETQIDMDSFDYSYYIYGLEHYGNIPFIEPLEWRETKKIHDFIIAIDTSMSCSGNLIQAFLEETYQILTEGNEYFSKVNIHILQCDDQIREDTLITDVTQMHQYAEEFEVKGYGGTDFRPVFEYVEKLKQEKKLNDLKGLLYFTDGRGTFPEKAPNYQTVFVFMQEEYEEVKVPYWAMKLQLSPYDLKLKEN